MAVLTLVPSLAIAFVPRVPRGRLTPTVLSMTMSLLVLMARFLLMVIPMTAFRTGVASELLDVLLLEVPPVCPVGCRLFVEVGVVEFIDSVVGRAILTCPFVILMAIVRWLFLLVLVLMSVLHVGTAPLNLALTYWARMRKRLPGLNGVKVGLSIMIWRKATVAVTFLILNLVSVCCECLSVLRWAVLAMTSPVSRELKPFLTILLAAKLLLSWMLGFDGGPYIASMLGVGRKPCLGLLLPTWNLNERLCRTGLLQLSLLLLVTWNRLWIRLTFDILLAIGRLIRKWAPILRKETALLRFIRNL